MHRRQLLRCAVTILAFTTKRWLTVCARSTGSAHAWRRAAAHDEHTARSLPATSGSGLRHRLLSSRPRAKHSSAVVPWLTTVATLRGGAASGRQVLRGRRHEPTVAYLASLRRPAKICTLFILSYLCSIGFNVNNKRALMLVPLPWTYAALNLLVGSVFALTSWSVKAAPWPSISRQDIGTLVPMAFLHAVSHLTVVLGLGAGAVSFLQTVKASEACFTAFLSFFFLGQTLPLPVYLTLVPVVVGVGITSCNQIRFSWLALLSALVSNLSNALRNVLIVRNIGPAAARNDRSRTGISPRRTHTYEGTTAATTTITTIMSNTPLARTFKSPEALTNTRAGGAKIKGGGLVYLAPGDTYRLLTVIGAILLFPAALYFESGSWPRLWQGATDAAAALVGRQLPLRAESIAGVGAGGDAGIGATSSVAGAAVAAAARGDWAEAFRRALISGVCFNVFYDLTFRLLGQLHPVTHAVGNTVKRIVVIGAGAAAFGGDLGGARGAMGSALAIFGVLAYSVAKARCKTSASGSHYKGHG